MTESDLKAFINTGVETWKRIKKDFSNSEAMSDFLMESYLNIRAASSCVILFSMQIP